MLTTKMQMVLHSAHLSSTISTIVIPCLDSKINTYCCCIPNYKTPVSFWSWAGQFQSFHNDPKFSDRLAWANSADPDQTAPRGAVWSVSTLFAVPSASFRSITLMVKPSCWNFRVITAKFSNVRIYRSFTVLGHTTWKTGFLVIWLSHNTCNISDARRKKNKSGFSRSRSVVLEHEMYVQCSILPLIVWGRSRTIKSDSFVIKTLECFFIILSFSQIPGFTFCFSHFRGLHPHSQNTGKECWCNSVLRQICTLWRT